MTTTRDDVFFAADALKEEGEEVSVNKIRKWLGKGSPNIVSPFLKEWRESQVQISAVPGEVENAGLHVIGSIWAIAREAANRQYEGDRIKLQNEIEQTIKDRDDAFNEVDALEVENSGLKTALQKAEAAAAEAAEEASEAAQELEDALGAAEGRITDLTERLSELRLDAQAQLHEAERRTVEALARATTLETVIADRRVVGTEEEQDFLDQVESMSGG